MSNGGTQSGVVVTARTAKYSGEQDYGVVAPWPTPYRADTDACTSPEPRLRRDAILALAPRLVQGLLDDNQKFGITYGDLVRPYRDEVYDDRSSSFLALFRQYFTLDIPSTNLLSIANEHDFANLHHAIWLLMLQGLARVLNFNIHDNWGDPPAGGTTQGRYDDDDDDLLSFHTIPNSYGSYAISSLDIIPPDLGIGEPLTPSPAKTGANLSIPQVQATARFMGRRIVVPQHGDPYLAIVKAYYRDRANYTAHFAETIVDELLHVDPDDPLAPGDPLAPDDPLVLALQNATDDDIANVHRGIWLFLAHRFAYVLGENPFLSYGDVSRTNPVPSVVLPMIKDLGGPRTFEAPNAGAFNVNLADVDPQDPRDYGS